MTGNPPRPQGRPRATLGDTGQISRSNQTLNTFLGGNVPSWMQSSNAAASVNNNAAAVPPNTQIMTSSVRPSRKRRLNGAIVARPEDSAPSSQAQRSIQKPHRPLDLVTPTPPQPHTQPTVPRDPLTLDSSSQPFQAPATCRIEPQIPPTPNHNQELILVPSPSPSLLGQVPVVGGEKILNETPSR